MTANEFYQEFKKIKDLYIWNVIGKVVRGKRKDTGCYCCCGFFCPITAVTREKNNVSFTEDGAMAAAVYKLKLQEKDGLDIINFADNVDQPNNKIMEILL